MSIKVAVDEIDLKSVEKRLGSMKDKAPKVISNALNRTAVWARQKTATQVKQAYTYNKSVRSQITVIKATQSKLSASLTAKGTPHSLTSFQHSAPRAGASAAVLRSGGGKKRIGPKGRRVWKNGNLGGANGALLQRKGEARYPIKFLRSVSTPKMMEGKRVYGATQPEIEEKLKQNIANQIKWLLENS